MFPLLRSPYRFLLFEIIQIFQMQLNGGVYVATIQCLNRERKLKSNEAKRYLEYRILKKNEWSDRSVGPWHKEMFWLF